MGLKPAPRIEVRLTFHHPAGGEDCYADLSQKDDVDPALLPDHVAGHVREWVAEELRTHGYWPTPGLSEGAGSAVLVGGKVVDLETYRG